MKSLLATRPSGVELADAAPRLLQVQAAPAGTDDGLRYLVEYPAGAALPDELAGLPRYDAIPDATRNTRWVTWLFLALGAFFVGVLFAFGAMGWFGLVVWIAGAIWLVAALKSGGWRAVPSESGRVVLLDELPVDAATPLAYRIRRWYSRLPAELLLGVAWLLWFTDGAAPAWTLVYAAFAVSGALRLLTPANAPSDRPHRWVRAAARALSFAAVVGVGAATISGLEQMLPRWLTGAVVAGLTLNAIWKHLRDEPVTLLPEIE